MPESNNRVARPPQQVWQEDQFQSFLAEIGRRRGAIADYLKDADAISIDVEDSRPRLALADVPGRFVIAPTMVAQLASKLNIPKAYLDRCAAERPRAFKANIEEWLHGRPGRHLVRTLDGRARAFLSDRYRILDNFDLLSQAVLPAIKESGTHHNMPLIVRQAAITDTRMYLKVTSPRTQGEIKRGDVVQSGFIVSNSEVGAGAWRAEQFLYRLVCSNGMIGEYSLARYHIGSARESDPAASLYSDDTNRKIDQAIIGQTRDIIAACLNKARLDVAIQRLQGLERVPIDVDPTMAVDAVGKRISGGAGFLESEKASIIDDLMRSRDLSAFGLLNSITATAREVPDYDRQVEMERAGGRLLEMDPADVARSITQAAG
jgi:hypothetical protein